MPHAAVRFAIKEALCELEKFPLSQRVELERKFINFPLTSFHILFGVDEIQV